MAIEKLTEKFVRGIKYDGRDAIIRDKELPGFILRVGKDRKTFSYRSERKGKAVSVPLGLYGDMSVEEARDAAEAAKVANKAGTLAPSGKRGQATIESTWPKFKTNREEKGRSAGTLRDAEYSMARLSDEVRNMSLHKLTNQVMVDEVARIRQKHGKMAGNGTARFVRALYRFAWRLDKKLPPGHPCESVVMIPTPKQPFMTGDMFAAWFVEMRALDNVQHCIAFELLLLSGLRRTDLLTLQWKYFDRKARTFHIPKPKGGSAKAFDLPLSDAMLDCLDRAREAGDTFLGGAKISPWVFPSTSKSGHVEKLHRKVSASPHTLRRSYGAAARVAGVASSDVSLLLNHRGATITEQFYASRDAIMPQLQEAQAKISQHIVGLFGQNGVAIGPRGA